MQAAGKQSAHLCSRQAPQQSPVKRGVRCAAAVPDQDVCSCERREFLRKLVVGISLPLSIAAPAPAKTGVNGGDWSSPGLNATATGPVFYKTATGIKIQVWV
jgi:hypothetical protein